MIKNSRVGHGSPYDESRALAAKFLNQGSSVRAVEDAGLAASARDVDPAATSHRSKIFESKKLSVLNIATRMNDHVG